MSYDYSSRTLFRGIHYNGWVWPRWRKQALLFNWKPWRCWQDLAKITSTFQKISAFLLLKSRRAAVNLSLSGHRQTEESEDTEHSQNLHRFCWTSDCAALNDALNINSERIYLRITYIFEVTPLPVLAGRIYLEKIGAAFPFHAKDRNSMST